LPFGPRIIVSASTAELTISSSLTAFNTGVTPSRMRPYMILDSSWTRSAVTQWVNSIEVEKVNIDEDLQMKTSGQLNLGSYPLVVLAPE